jgi:predicted nucleic acid-binding protein
VRTVYIDASALVKLAVTEPGREAVVALANDALEVRTSVIAKVEVRRAVRRVAPAFDVDPILDQCTFVEVTHDVLERAARLEPAATRSLDAIHVATALSIGSDLEAFITFDRRQAAAAGRDPEQNRVTLLSYTTTPLR